MLPDWKLIEIKNMLLLCGISYGIKNSEIYMPKSYEEDMFKVLSTKIKIIPSMFPKAQTIAIESKDTKTLFIAFAGTHDIHDIIDDLEYPQVVSDYSHDIKFFEGFYKEFTGLTTSIRKTVEEFLLHGDTIYLTGHSSGGCVASIVAYFLYNVLENTKGIKIKVITFGSPYFTNNVGAKWFEENIDYTRVVIDKDPIPNLPQVNPINRIPKYFHIMKNFIYVKNNSVFINKVPEFIPSWFNFTFDYLNRKFSLYFHKINTYKSKLNGINN